MIRSTGLGPLVQSLDRAVVEASPDPRDALRRQVQSLGDLLAGHAVRAQQDHSYPPDQARTT